mmetsp:Transcript_144757/g.360946  ORF Transcript_144757/g.360946 Transcript_144757/m.360946 type:complete len:217 (-) Transcript_144757:79-729(-)
MLDSTSRSSKNLNTRMVKGVSPGSDATASSAPMPPACEAPIGRSVARPAASATTSKISKSPGRPSSVGEPKCCSPPIEAASTCFPAGLGAAGAFASAAVSSMATSSSAAKPVSSPRKNPCRTHSPPNRPRWRRSCGVGGIRRQPSGRAASAANVAAGATWPQRLFISFGPSLTALATLLKSCGSFASLFGDCWQIWLSHVASLISISSSMPRGAIM